MAKKPNADMIDHLVCDLQNAKDNDSPFAFIMGAGASVSAGVPTAKGIVEEIQNTYPPRLKKLSASDQNNYNACMRALTANQRTQLLAPHLKQAGINWGHIALAQLIIEGYITRVLTFNFDLILERAISLLGEQFPVYDFAVAPQAKLNKLPSPSIIHLHGQSYGFSLLNTDDEVEQHQQSIAPLFEDTLAKQPAIVFGYSGDADASLPTIRKSIDDHQLLWLGHDSRPSPAVQELIEEQSYVEFFGDADFDLVMIELAQQLHCWPPKIFDNPSQHLLDELKPIKPYPNEIGSIDILGSLKTRLQQHEDQLQLSPNERSAMSSTPADNVSEAEEGEDPNVKSWLYINKGYKLCKDAVKLGDEHTKDKLQLYRDGISQFERAFSISQERHEALYNWGVAISRIAELSTENERIALYHKAIKKYQSALEIKPDDHQSINNLSNSYLKIQQLTNEPDKKQWLKKAEEAALKTIELKPSKRYNYVCVLALTERLPQAMEELYKTRDYKTLPSIEHLKTDPDLEALRPLPAFKQFIKELQAERNA